MLSCKDVARRASEYLDGEQEQKLVWQMRLHLMMCSNCRRFARHLKITRQISVHIAQQQAPTDPEVVWQKINQRLKSKDI
jgi:predicted anti-sigma-YlaC factor YlaD